MGKKVEPFVASPFQIGLGSGWFRKTTGNEKCTSADVWLIELIASLSEAAVFQSVGLYAQLQSD